MKSICCPLCNVLLNGKFTSAMNGSMARWYWYCRDCKLSMMKSVRKGELK